MTDAPTPRRHRGTRRAAKRKRGLVGPIASALSVLVAIGPVIYLMSRDNSTVNDATKVLNVSEDTRDNSGGSLVGDASKGPLKTVTQTLANGKVTTAVIGTGANGMETTSTPSTPGGTPPSGSPSNVLTTPTAPTTGVTTVTVDPSNPKTPDGRPSDPRPSRPTPTKTRTTTQPTQPTQEPSNDPEPPPSGGGGTNAQEREVLELTNSYREQAGCGPLRLNSALVEAAGRHASDMVRRHYLDHTNPDGQDPGDRMRAAGYSGSSWGENIAAGYPSAQKVVSAWMKSEGHRKNILNCRFTVIGIGYDDGRVKPDWGPGSWVQDFGRN
ncbi:CAP domain-containing protein [Kribbella sandramycini]|uniref:CAP domain-containing protein n=1 Tax=Kribbella sandramycini TaxID=60450 RepID=A0A7Y4P1S7_9ACTN|nr:CAP domain-containing protein [Kribbella sandramycini]MBB6566860.1 uncharacterized protein YkwD [Kribbella sandramycini]NOL44582.1 CAP domain-containing protein [Kribbella sandramycini]